MYLCTLGLLSSDPHPSSLYQASHFQRLVLSTLDSSHVRFGRCSVSKLRKTLKRSTSCQSSYLKEENVFPKSLSVSSNADSYRKLETGLDSRTRKFKAIETLVARYHEMKKMKVTRKKRTKTYWVSSGSEISSSCKPVEKLVSPSGSGSTSAVSCLTNNSCLEFSVQSNARLGKKSSPKRKVDKVIKGDTSNRIGSGHIRRRAEGILKMLATIDSASEVRIREMLGDTPDTSKALRILLRRGQVKRHGAGGRGDPYTYSIA